MSANAAVNVRVRKVRDTHVEDVEDVLAAEEPLEIRILEFVDGEEREHALAVTMRTPGHDSELAAGFLFSEGVLWTRDEIVAIEPGSPRAVEEAGNVIRVRLHEGATLDLSRALRSFYTTSSCGVCGKTSLDALWARRPPPIHGDTPRVAAATLAAMPETLRRAQDVFERTGGLHAAALFRADGRLLTLREDIGRHNAVDKVVGERFLACALPLGDRVLLVSGRASFEILQKAVIAGVPFVAAVGAPSSLAVDVAREFGVTLVGFLRGNAFNVYAGGERVGD